MKILHLPALALAITGVGLTLATPAFAEQAQRSWTLSIAPPPPIAPRVAMLPPLPQETPRFYAITPERRALLNTIRYAEGTWANGHPIGYRILFGGSVMPSLERHPNRVMYTARYASAAAGAYQFMPFTWSMASRALGLNGFHEEAQDQAALYLIHRRGALPLADRGVINADLMAALSKEWASLPTHQGVSYYGQPVKRLDDLRRFYEDNLSQLRSGGTPRWETVAVRQVRQSSCQDGSLECRLRGISASETRVIR